MLFSAPIGKLIRMVVLACALPLAARALPPLADITQPGDPIQGTSNNTPPPEGVANAIDNQPTKYLNFDRLNTGFTVKPTVGATVVLGLSLTSANDAPERDPASFLLSGSNDGINFSQFASGNIPVFTNRFQKQTFLFSNPRAYLHYRLIFPLVRGPGGNSMQISEVELLGFPTSLLRDVTRPGDRIIPTSGNSPGSEGVMNAIDDQPTKYLNFDRLNTGFAVTPSSGPSLVNGITLTSANDAPERDPSTYTLEGSLDGVNFAPITTGSVSFASRFNKQSIFFQNNRAFRTYRLIFPTVAGPGGNSMQIAEVELLGGPGSLTSLYTFDSFGFTDATAASKASPRPGSTLFFNTDHLLRASSALALNDVVNGTTFGTQDFLRITTPNLPNNSNHELGLNKDFTVTAWVFPRIIGGWKILLGNTGPGGPGTLHFGLFDNHVHMGFWNNDIRGSREIPAGRWTHLAFTYRSHGGEMAIYVDGQLDTTDFGRANTTGEHQVLLGFCEAIAGSYWQGFIDDFAIYCDALDPNQIAALAKTRLRPDADLPTPAISPLPNALNLWAVREIYAHPNLTYSRAAAEAIATSPELGSSTNYTSLVINRHDPETNPSFMGFFGDKEPWAANNLTPQGRIDGDDNNLVLVARTTLNIAEESDYTLGFNTDDGARLRIFGAVFSSSTYLGNPAFPNAAVPAHLDGLLSYPGYTSSSTTLGVTHLKPGKYELEFLTWENGGGSFAEVFAAKGAFSQVTPDFRLLSPGLFLPAPTLSISRVSPSEVVVSWVPETGILQHSETPEGPWLNHPAKTGQVIPVSGTLKFFRVVQ